MVYLDPTRVPLCRALGSLSYGRWGVDHEAICEPRCSLNLSEGVILPERLFISDDVTGV